MTFVQENTCPSVSALNPSKLNAECGKDWFRVTLRVAGKPLCKALELCTVCSWGVLAWAVLHEALHTGMG